ncbi:MAG: periplasmic heavy metal sensor, partial [Mesorhizobium sp.]
LAAAEKAQPFDEAAVRQAMAAVRAATTNLQATVQDYLLAAMKNVNAKPAGGG